MCLHTPQKFENPGLHALVHILDLLRSAYCDVIIPISELMWELTDLQRVQRRDRFNSQSDNCCLINHITSCCLHNHFNNRITAEIGGRSFFLNSCIRAHCYWIVSVFGCLILTTTYLPMLKITLDPQESFCAAVSLFFLRSKRLWIPHIWTRPLFTGQRVHIVTLYTKESKRGLSQPVQDIQSTNGAHQLRKEAGICGGSQAPPSTLSEKTDTELVPFADELEGPFTWKEGSVKRDGVTEKWNFYSTGHTSVSGGTLLFTGAVHSQEFCTFNLPLRFRTC